MGKIIAALVSILGVIAGFATGISLVAYSIYTVVLMVKGTVAVSFLAVVEVVGLWVCAGLGGWVVAAFFLFVAGLIAAASDR
jgi:hypothetical protein